MKLFVAITTERLCWVKPIMVDHWRFVNDQIKKAGSTAIAYCEKFMPSLDVLHYSRVTNTGHWIDLIIYMLVERGAKEGYTAAYKNDEIFFEDLIQIYRSDCFA
jgi:hypothetical protein